jgi:hypothetical protein
MITATPGSWKSPISAQLLASAGVSLGFVQVVAGEIYWDESRPEEGGRTAVVGSTQGELLPAPWSAVTRVHEMGGLSWLVCNWRGESGLLFAEKSDQRIYWKAVNSDPVAVTPVSSAGTLARYSDFLIRGQEIWCVRDITHEHETNRSLIAINPAGEIRILDSKSHFYAHLALSPNENKLAWISWEHPQMPWDGTHLRVASVTSAGELEAPQVRAGGLSEAVNSPVWCDEDKLYFISDASGFWNVWSVDNSGNKKQIFSEAAEWAQPMWLVGARFLQKLPDGRLVGIHGDPANESLVIGDPETGLWQNCNSELLYSVRLLFYQSLFAYHPTINSLLRGLQYYSVGLYSETSGFESLFERHSIYASCTLNILISLSYNYNCRDFVVLLQRYCYFRKEK